MASAYERTPSLEADASSELEPDEPLSRQQLARRSDSNLPLFSFFATTLFYSLKKLIVKKHSGHYDSVHVLHLAWGVPAGSTIKELNDLKHFMKTHLKFTTEYYQLARDDAGDELNSKLEDVVRAYGGANELLIIYYAGHGRLDMGRKTTTWQATRDFPSTRDHILLGSNSSTFENRLNWSTIETRLNQSIARDSNILYILDSCYTPGTFPLSPGGSKELLAASKDMSKSNAFGDYLFTADLLHELRQQTESTGSISVSTLYSLIIERQAERQIPEPFHLALSDKASSSSIVLASMTEGDPCIPSSLKESQSVTLCKIQVEVFPVSTLTQQWEELINNSPAVEKVGLKIHPADYVNRLDSRIVGQFHVILVSMPTEVSRKLVKTTRSRFFAELKTVESEAAITSDIVNEALRKAVAAI